MRKTCKVCGIEKDISEFYFRKDSNSYRAECKECIRLHSRKYHEEHKEERLEYNKQWQEDNKAYVKVKRKDYYLSNREEALQQSKEYYQEHKAEKQEYDRQYYLSNREEINEYNRVRSKHKRDTDASFRLRSNVSRLVVMMLKSNNGQKNGKSILDYLPYTIDELKIHIEKQFELWMNWNNYGAYRANTWDEKDSTTWKWQLDHIIPQSKLPYNSMADKNFQKCWALENLRPLSAKRNLLDGVNRVRHQ